MKWMDVEVPWVKIDGHWALTREAIVNEPDLMLMVLKFSSLFEPDYRHDAVILKVSKFKFLQATREAE